MRATTIAAAGLALLAIPAPADADDITEALTAAIAAYEQGEVQDALDEIAYATQLLNEMKTQGLEQFLPEPLDGWTREIGSDAGQAMGFMGGGIAAEADYTGPGGRFTITMIADSPLVASMAAVLGNSTVLATMGRIERINRQTFLNADGELQGLIGNRVLLQASGGSVEDMAAHLAQIDFDALEAFGR